MANIPGIIRYGHVIGRFVSFTGDTADAGNEPDEVPLTGTVTLTPQVTVLKVSGATPPRTAIAQTLVCPIVNGDLCAPGTSTPGVYLIATTQPDASPSTVQWRATFTLTGVDAPPAAVIFNVPDAGEVDLTSVIPAATEPGTITVVQGLPLAITDVSGLSTELANRALFPNSVKSVQKDPTTGFWPSGYDSNGDPIYTGGSSSAAVRPSSSDRCMVIWVGAAPAPPYVTTGTGGMHPPDLYVQKG